VTEVTVGCIVGSLVWILALGTRLQLEVRKRFFSSVTVGLHDHAALVVIGMEAGVASHFLAEASANKHTRYGSLPAQFCRPGALAV
jgi:hypothetical protein